MADLPTKQTDTQSKASLENSSSETEQDSKLNTYEGIAQYYDVLMTNGYYDYSEIAKALHGLLGPRQKVLELGVGTGLLAEKLLALDSSYKITGVDNTESMLKQAKDRLDNQVQYEMQDLTRLTLDDEFQAAFSVGGCWYFIDTGHDLEFCSHISDPALSRQGLERVLHHLAPKSILALSLQGVHTDYSKELTDGLVYSQKITEEASGFTKEYLFHKGEEIVASQTYRYLTLPVDKVNELFDELGCDSIGLDKTRKFFMYRKR